MWSYAPPSFIKTIGEYENHTGDPRARPTRQYYERLQNQTNPHNILTQTNIGVAEEVRVQLSNNSNLKRNIRQNDNIISTLTLLRFLPNINKQHVVQLFYEKILVLMLIVY